MTYAHQILIILSVTGCVEGSSAVVRQQTVLTPASSQKSSEKPASRPLMRSVLATESKKSDADLKDVRFALSQQLEVAANTQVDLMAESVSLSQRLQALANRLDPGPTSDLLHALKLCAPCKHLQRFGEDHDGGYVMCTDDLDGLVAAYSYGVNGFDGWGMQVASLYRIPLYQYDCHNTKAPTPCEGCHVYFHPECLANSKEAEGDKGSEFPSKTFAQHLAANGHMNNAGNVLLKVDVEAAEWKVFAQEDPKLLQNYRQILVEFHWLDQKDQHELYAQAVQNIERAGFVVAHLHGNNFAGMATFDDFSIPNVLEVTYVRRPLEGCTSNVEYHDAKVDRTNNPGSPELPDAVLPTTA